MEMAKHVSGLLSLWEKVNKIGLLLHTVRYLKPIQVGYRLKYFFRNRLGKSPQLVVYNDISRNAETGLKFKPSIDNNKSYSPENAFTFLNLEHTFSAHIDWNYAAYGRLWTYNLNYFEYVNQKDISVEERLKLIDEFIKSIDNNKTGLEPYPISLRVMNWIRFFITHHIDDEKYNGYVWAQLQLLRKLKEYHLMGNHLLENGFAFLFGAYYLNDSTLYKEAKTILLPELKEQILKDGAHFELSPMYHSLMTYRLLDCYNLVISNDLFNRELETFLKKELEGMLSFLQAISFRNGYIPLMNDAANGIAPTPSELFDYAHRLGLDMRESTLSDSGYRKFTSDSYELVLDVGEVGPSYQPGHAHADTFNFQMHINNRPVVIDTGTSTYEVNETRFYERSTRAHNTVTIGDENSSQVWAGHRVAKRANVELFKDDTNCIVARHDGYKKKFGVYHTREVVAEEKIVTIIDDLEGQTGVAHFHFAPGEYLLEDNQLKGVDFRIVFTNYKSIEKVATYHSPEFNKRVDHISLKILFTGKLTTQIFCE
jgi:hypothetical protein